MDAIPSTPFLTDTAPATLFVALELSRSTWLVAVHSPAVDKVSQHRLEGGDTKGLLELITRKRTQVAEKLGFRDEGMRPRLLHIDGDWRDHLSYALTAEEVGPGGLIGRWRRVAPPQRS